MTLDPEIIVVADITTTIPMSVSDMQRFAVIEYERIQFEIIESTVDVGVSTVQHHAPRHYSHQRSLAANRLTPHLRRQGMIGRRAIQCWCTTRGP